MTDHPHQGQPVQTRGPPREQAAKAVILVHGRGASATSILELANDLPQDSITYLAPQARDRQWYPHSFLEPVDRNEPGRSSALRIVDGLVDRAMNSGIPQEQVYIGGFSQGGCVATEYGARHPQKYGGVFALSGGLIGGTIDIDRYSGDMDGTPVFLGCSDQDPHIPLERVEATATVFERLNAGVTKRIYDGMGHIVNRDELQYLQQLLR